MKMAGKAISVTSSFLKALEANHPKGIRVRSRLAVICAVVFIVIDVIFVAYNYDYLPDIIPAFEDTEGIFIKAVEKSSYIGYDFQRLAILISAFIVAWAIKPCFKTDIIYRRVRCLILDIANLTIVSAIAMTMLELAIAKGESKEISYSSQWIAFLFWVVVMASEFAFDLRKIRKSGVV